MKKQLLAGLFLTAGFMAKAQRSYFLEAEDFSIRGGWIVEKPPGGGVSGKHILRVISGGVKAADALTVVRIQQAGEYTVWTKTVDFPGNRPGSRLFQVLVNDVPLAQESGKHGHADYRWEKAGVARMDTGENVIQLRDSRGNYPRVDALFLTAENISPDKANLPTFKITPAPVHLPPAALPGSGAKKIGANAEVVAALENEHLKLEIIRSEGLFARTAVKHAGKWQYLDASVEENRILLLSADDPQITFGGFIPGWNGSRGFSSFSCKGKTYKVMLPENLGNPFLSGDVTAFTPANVEKTTTGLRITYRSSDGQTINGTWTLRPAQRHLQLTLEYTAPRNAYYSLAVGALQGMAENEVSNIQLPPMFQYQRLPQQPVLLPSALMPQPVAIMELEKKGLTVFISGAKESFPQAWGTSHTSPMGFGIRNERNEMQPVAFSPVPGLDDSKLKSGQRIKRSFALGALPSGWNDALEYISDSIYTVKDYRSQQLSLTETVFNIISLINNDTASGWAPELKGFYDIEADPKAAPTVVQAAPLAVVAAAVLSRNEDFYIRRALPSIEYTLSRSGFRWAQKGMSKTAAAFSPYNSQFSTTYYEGLYRLLGETNPWLKKIALPNDQVRKTAGYSVVVPSWTQELAAYRLTGQKRRLDSAVVQAKAFAGSEIFGRKTTPLGKVPFYNTSFYAYWWDLNDLYDATGDTSFLNAAYAAAFHTLAGVRSYPAVAGSQQTIHPGNTYEGNTTMWWKGGEKYRLGFPRKPGDAPEKKVPAWLVSPVGLGFEQPVTFFPTGREVRHVFMSSWAPHLLRLYGKSGRKIFETYARNAVIGRFTNYPGYYATGYTDITMRPDFPYKGPDVSSIYYHHIPPHLAFTMDFLVTDIMQRSRGNVLFPYVKQDGFVWFNSRVFGAGAGKVFSDDAVSLWLKKGLVHIDNPQVNYLTGISGNNFWVILASETKDALNCRVELGEEAPVNGNTAKLYTMDAQPSPLAVKTRAVNVRLEGKGFAALCFPLDKKLSVKKTAVLKNGMQVVDMGQGIGRCYIFRIRSPFGWDSVYGYLESLESGNVTVSVNHREETIPAYPFEWSFHPLKTGEDAQLYIKVKTKDGRTVEKTIVM
ncbi:hypothetical protein ACFOTA_08035 [Chitinophaga sp. GCM10012297]|uniref:Alpha-L-rhamnosidase six-hairpin glycosidase domain-containing protein n=1 Tax=Chitinophaga chungangae TaxID=2821488 RepID=A0ABS3YBT7_9BACT|nr:hypothetical protein [Chitinophaga chungangae]MBO9152152.1 hypothetical protein [Chitinophaga chungangae]